MTEPAVVEFHHQVLPYWARSAEKCGRARLFSLTLDHHTDVLAAFSHLPEPRPEIFPQNVSRAVELLHHDEHIDWALRAGILRHANVISQENFTPPAHPEMTVICDELWPDSGEIFAGTERAVHAAETFLESDFLARQLQKAVFAEPYILDIDLDCFLCRKALEPDDPAIFQELVRHAELITVSMERDWHRILRLPGETFTADDALRMLKKLFPKNE